MTKVIENLDQWEEEERRLEKEFDKGVCKPKEVHRGREMRVKSINGLVGNILGPEFENDGIKYVPVRWNGSRYPVLTNPSNLEPLPPEFPGLDGWIIVDKETMKSPLGRDPIIWPSNFPSQETDRTTMIPVRVILRKERDL